MPSKHMLPKGKRRQSVRAEYRIAREAASEADVEAAGTDDAQVNLSEAEASTVSVGQSSGGTGKIAESIASPEGIRSLRANQAASGMRLDAFLAQAIPDISRARAQMLIEAGQVQVNAARVKASHKLHGGETVIITGEPRPEPLHATPEDIPLHILFEDEYLAVIDKPAGMAVHAGAGATEDARSRGTLVNALLHHMAQLSTGQLSGAGGELRPGIVHRLDKETSGAMVVAKDDLTHRRLSEMFAARRVKKRYLALVHGRVVKDDVTVDLPVARDLVRRTRMTTRRADGRAAVSHLHVLERLATPWGDFTLIEVRIETGRTHQIRIHMQALGHPVAGDTLYGAPRILRPVPPRKAANPRLTRTAGERTSSSETGEDTRPGPGRNFLHSAHLEFEHPATRRPLVVDAPLPEELESFLKWLQSEDANRKRSSRSNEA